MQHLGHYSRLAYGGHHCMCVSFYPSTVCKHVYHVGKFLSCCRRLLSHPESSRVHCNGFVFLSLSSVLQKNLFSQKGLDIKSCYRQYVCVHAKLFQSCPTLCNSMDCSLPGPEWVPMPSSTSSRGSS